MCENFQHNKVVAHFCRACGEFKKPKNGRMDERHYHDDLKYNISFMKHGCMLGDRFQEVFDIDMRQQDGLPSRICKNCVIKFEG